MIFASLSLSRVRGRGRGRGRGRAENGLKDLKDEG